MSGECGEGRAEEEEEEEEEASFVIIILFLPLFSSCRAYLSLPFLF